MPIYLQLVNYISYIGSVVLLFSFKIYILVFLMFVSLLDCHSPWRWPLLFQFDVESPCSILFTAVSIFLPLSAYLRSLVRFKCRQEYNVLELAQVFINFLFCLLYFYFLIFYLTPFRVIIFYYCHMLPEYWVIGSRRFHWSS